MVQDWSQHADDKRARTGECLSEADLKARMDIVKDSCKLALKKKSKGKFTLSLFCSQREITLSIL